MALIKSITESDFFEVLGAAAKNLVSAFRYIFKGKIDLEQLRQQIVFIGYECLPMIIAMTSIACMILAINTATELANHGGREATGALIAIADLREILPLFIAFAIGARSGTAITAETATMKITEQIDALKVMKTDPIYFLLSPRLLAVILLAPFLVSIAAVISVFTGMIISNISTGLEYYIFLESVWKGITLKEYFYPLLKTEIFTIYAILINVTMGLRCEGGAKEVGLSTNKATAWVMIGIIILDGVLTPMLYTDPY